jgi:DNA gyrase subunit A
MAGDEDNEELEAGTSNAPLTELGLFDVKSHEILPKMYLAYALSVIKDRSLPDIRDGLKPVARRVLFGMNEMGVTHTKATRKSARVVGEVMGKYHPHGDGSIYGTAVRLVQPFTTRYPLIIGQGNFGSVEDDPAAMRYTEMKLSAIAEEVVADIDKQTVDFMPNFDGTLQEPKVLPTRVPLFLLNGSVGIAVGMATTAPPHNLTEVIDALLVYIDNEDVTVPELMKYMKGPDFPSGAYMFDHGVQSIYETGRGSVTLRAKAEIVDQGKRQMIVITELPYQLDKSKLIARIADLYKQKEKKIEGIDGITDIRDESDRDGTRLVIELRRGVHAKMVLSTLFRRTELQTKYPCLMRALINNVPKLVGLKEVFWHFLDHRKSVVIRRTEFELSQAEKKAHILKGYIIAFDNLDSILEDVKSAKSTEDTYKKLRKYKLSDDQIKAILELRVQRIAQFERDSIVKEHSDVVASIEGMKKLLGSEELVLQKIKSELVEIKQKYGDARRTKLIKTLNKPTDDDTKSSKDDEHDGEEIAQVEEIQEEVVVVTVTKKGLVKRTPMSEYRVQNVKGKGLIGVEVKDGDYLENVFQLSTRDYALVFTDRGRCHKMNVHEIPSLGRTAAGSSILNILHLEEGEKIASVVPVTTLKDRLFVMVTRRGQVKRLKAEKLQRPRVNGTKVIGLAEGDELIGVKLLDRVDLDMLLVTRNGMSIRFAADTIRPSGKSGAGVRAIRLEQDDEIVAANVVSQVENETCFLMTVTERGYSKRTILKKFRVQRRGGRGIICMDANSLVGKIIEVGIIRDDREQFILVTTQGILIRLRAGQIRKLGRNTQGSRIQKLDTTDSVAAVAFIGIIEGDDDDGSDEPADGGPVQKEELDKDDENEGADDAGDNSDEKDGDDKDEEN